ncbi:hypothetical protein BD26P3_00042 [Phocaeicola phage BD26P3]|nr:hypothetical protein BD26P1_00043 [Phocaeicola phage BD26P1]WAX06075.1 hypothetical protein BD26P2_00028 [Phocaeicola phage BD26P2]WAX06138.1 hypothetical protein BD26P3_00042 [Phocaeicola phage BD26P3]WAX06172.1 hypothetical protein BD26P4_00028 [Phocaeicola phage BD26P4]WAX06236.1 hypothetical protein BD26P5_00043 [Phocaeicola phage BD26P5]
MITFQEAKELFIYDRDTGIIKWRKRFNPMQRADLVAGNTSRRDGYTRISFKDKPYLAHRIAMLLSFGFCDDRLQVDHINHIRDDNRLSNLRFVTFADNQRNKTKRSNNTSGVTGVSYCKDRRKYVAQIVVDGANISLGRFVTLEEAAEVRKAAEIKYNYNANHGNNKIKEYAK